MGVSRVARRELPRLAARGGDLVKVGVGRRVRARIPIGGGHEDDRLAVGRPRRLQAVARSLGGRAAETGRGGQPGAGEEIAGRPPLDGDGEQPHLGVVEPAVPAADGKAVVDPHFRPRVLPLGGDPLVGFRIGGPGVDEGLVQERLAVRTPYRRPRGERRGRHAARLPAAGHVEDVDLADVVVLAPGRESDPAAVGAPGRTALGRPGGREAARLRAAVRGHDPQVHHFLLLVVGGFGHREGDPLAVRGNGRRSDPLHEPEGFMGQGLLGSSRLGDAGARGNGHGDGRDDDERSVHGS